MGVMRNAYRKFWSENLKRKDQLGDTGVDGRMTLRWILRKKGVRIRTGFNWLRTRSRVGLS
jgi:hypothetical protein